MHVIVSLLALLGLFPVALAGTPPPGFTDTAVLTGLSAPTAIAFLPDGRMLVTEKGGMLSVASGGIKTPLITISVCQGSEMGLLGVAVDPAFESNGFIYLYRTKPEPAPGNGCANASGRFNQVVRVTMVGDTATSLTELLTGIRTDNGNHDGGGLRIGTDGKLYVAVGDTGRGDNQGGPGSSTNPYAQDLNALEGKLLRLELSGAPAAGNPFLGMPGTRGEIFAYGFRNPWRFGIDPVTGRPWVGDVGDLTVEELDVVTPGGNYAWPHCEGMLPVGCQQLGDIDPFFTYLHDIGSTVIGGAFAPVPFGGLAGQFFFADYGASTISRGVPNGVRTGLSGVPQPFVTGASGPVDLVFGPSNSLYYVAIFSGEVRRVQPNGCS